MNDTCWSIVIDAASAIGTFVAVGVSLYLSRKESGNNKRLRNREILEELLTSVLEVKEKSRKMAGELKERTSNFKDVTRLKKTDETAKTDLRKIVLQENIEVLLNQKMKLTRLKVLAIQLDNKYLDFSILELGEEGKISLPKDMESLLLHLTHSYADLEQIWQGIKKDQVSEPEIVGKLNATEGAFNVYKSSLNEVILYWERMEEILKKGLRKI